MKKASKTTKAVKATKATESVKASESTKDIDTQAPVENQQLPEIPSFMVKTNGTSYVVPIHEVKDGKVSSILHDKYLSQGVVPTEDQVLEHSLQIDICRGDHKDPQGFVLSWDGETFDEDGTKVWKDDQGTQYSTKSKNVHLIKVTYNDEMGFYFIEGTDKNNPEYQIPEDQTLEKDGERFVLAVERLIDVDGNTGVTHEGVLSAILYDLQLKNATAKSPGVAQAIIRLQEAIMWLKL